MDDAELYYLTSSDYHNFEDLKSFYIVKKMMSTDNNSMFWLVKIDPVVIGQEYGLGGNDIEYLLLAPRQGNNLLDNIKQYPVHVYFLLPNKDLRHNDDVSVKDFKNIAWGKIIKDPADINKV
jgi:hypothetical protein